MVKIFKPGFVFFWVIFIGSLSMPFSTLANINSDVQLSVSSMQIELGKPVSITLTSAQTGVSLDKIDLSPLLPDFHIKDTGEITVQDNQQHQRITLYPRKTGRLFIPQIYFINSSTQAVAIDVTPPIDSKNNTVIELQTSVSTLTPWKKQQVLVKLEFMTQAGIVVFFIGCNYLLGRFFSSWHSFSQYLVFIVVCSYNVYIGLDGS